MYCKLCFRTCEEFTNLYDEDGQQNECYNVTSTYFAVELQGIPSIDRVNNFSRVLCATCWKHIKEFSDFQQQIRKAHESYENIIVEGDGIKLEVDSEVFPNNSGLTNACTDDVDIKDTIDFELYSIAKFCDSPIHEKEVLKILDNDTSLSDEDVPLKARKNSKRLSKVKDNEVFLNNTAYTNTHIEDVNIKNPIAFELNLKAKDCDRPIHEKEVLKSFGNNSSLIDEDVPLKRTRKNKRLSKVKASSKTFIVENCKPSVAKKKKTKIKKSPKSSSSNEKYIQNMMKKEENDQLIFNFKKDLNCALCTYECTNFTDLISHFKQNHDIPGYLICCGKKFFHRSHLVDHINVHINIDYFKCELCDYVAGTRRTLSTHMKNKHPTEIPHKTFECENCHKKFLRESFLKSHMLTHISGSKDFVCQECGKGFVLESILKKHIKHVHEKSYYRVCELCGKSFAGKKLLAQHLLAHQGIAQDKWPCDKCDAQLYSKYSLGRHKKIAHADGSTVYVCSECGKVARTETALRTHKNYMHKTKKQLECKICKKSFKIALTLKEHMASHTGNDLYNCPHCPRTFRSSANMHHHRKRVHRKEWEENRRKQVLASKLDLSEVEKVVL